uniref:Uncharacterized protein n=1 Tax=Oryza meridionalis TaxID=40149 RepID=A0A0E0DHT5_9ORYZ
MPRKVVSGPDYDDEYDDDYDEYDEDYDDYGETGHSGDIQHPVKEEKESSKKSSSTVPVLWRCSMCMFDNHESMVYFHGIPSGFGTPSMPKSDCTKMPVNTRTTDFDGDPEIKNASISHEKVGSTQYTSAGSSSGAGKKLKEDQSSRATSSAQNEDVAQKLSSDIQKLGLEKNEVDTAKPYLPEEYKPEKWMFANEESGVLSQLNLAIVCYTHLLF